MSALKLLLLTQNGVNIMSQADRFVDLMSELDTIVDLKSILNDEMYSYWEKSKNPQNEKTEDAEYIEYLEEQIIKLEEENKKLREQMTRVLDVWDDESDYLRSSIESAILSLQNVLDKEDLYDEDE